MPRAGPWGVATIHPTSLPGQNFERRVPRSGWPSKDLEPAAVVVGAGGAAVVVEGVEVLGEACVVGDELVLCVGSWVSWEVEQAAELGADPGVIDALRGPDHGGPAAGRVGAGAGLGVA